MQLSPEENPMVWVIVQTVEGTEQFVGQQHPDLDINYIPFFDEKEDAQQGMSFIKRRKGSRCEAQALRLRELARDAGRHGFLLFHTDADGQILDKIDPQQLV